LTSCHAPPFFFFLEVPGKRAACFWSARSSRHLPLFGDVRVFPFKDGESYPGGDVFSPWHVDSPPASEQLPRPSPPVLTLVGRRGPLLSGRPVFFSYSGPLPLLPPRPLDPVGRTPSAGLFPTSWRLPWRFLAFILSAATFFGITPFFSRWLFFHEGQVSSGFWDRDLSPRRRRCWQPPFARFFFFFFSSGSVRHVS